MERIWLKNYPKGVPHDIDPSIYRSLNVMIEQNLRKYAANKAYACMGKTLTFGEIDSKAEALAAYLQSQGLKAGDRIALMMPNLLQYPIALFACFRAGFIVVNTNPLYTEREMKHQFKDAGVKAIIIAENFAFNLEQIISETDIKTVVLASVGELLGFPKSTVVNFVVRKIKKLVPVFKLPQAITFSQALSLGKGKAVMRHVSDPEDTIVIQYTGGTTGVAKGAELTNRNLIANMMQVRACMADFVSEGKEVMMTPLPMYHIFSFTVNALCMLQIGSMCVLVTNPRDQKALLKDFKSHKITIMTGVNTLFNALNNNPEFQTIDFSKLRIVSGGAMAVQRSVAERWKQITGAPICEGYGMTESSPVATTNPFDGSGRIGTIGLPIPSTLIRICHEEDPLQELPLGERGEIQIFGPQVMKGYYNRPDETAKTITSDGWLRTGDIGIMDEDGFIRIVDRLKDMILVSGFNVYPNEIEEVVAAHPKVLEAAAVGIPDANSGEAVKLFVVKKDESLTEEELRLYCRENLTGYKNPKRIEFKTELPKTNVGKVLRRALRDGQA